MKIILIYISSSFTNKPFIENYLKDIDKIYLDHFDLNELKKVIYNYEYIIYLDDNTNYNFNNLLDDINNLKKIVNENNDINQVLFYNYEYSTIDEKILNYDKTYIYNEIMIFNEKKIKTDSNIDYKNYVNLNFNKFFLPSLIKTSLLLNYEEILINNPHHELKFINKNNLNRCILNKNKFINFKNSESKIIKNINNDLTIVTGFIKLNEKKIQKYSFQKYEYLDSCNDTLKLNINMVIYVTEDIYDFVYKKRKEFNLLNKTKIIKINIKDFMYFYDKLNIIEENVKKNHRNYSSAKKILSVVSRYNYLKDTIKHNYFNSKYFAWLDFSAGHIVKIPNEIIFNDNFGQKIKIGWIGRYKKENFKYNNKVFAGGFFIGNKYAMSELINFHNKYFKILMDYGYTINDDKLLFFIFESNPFLFKTYFTDYSNILLKSII